MSTAMHRITSDMAALDWFRPIAVFMRRAEDGVAGAVLLAMGLLPVLELILRTFFNMGIQGSVGYVQNLTLWVAFVGAMVGIVGLLYQEDG